MEIKIDTQRSLYIFQLKYLFKYIIVDHCFRKVNKRKYGQWGKQNDTK